MKRTITVFGSSLPIEGEEQFIFAEELGKELALNNFDVCTGGFAGIMNAVSKGATLNGGKAIGVTVNLWNAKPSKYLTEEIKCKTLFERIEKLVSLGDGYVVLQGGTGTMLELTVVWEFINKGMLNEKPIVTHSNMWKEIVEIMEKQIKLEKRKQGLVKSFNTAKDITNYLKSVL
ncbi:MAG: DNA-binding protein [Ignavibacteriales bacterium CG12_big_fil_rev_8_21_14_0_65_30_8]|nr:MAG: DNA-binding protein [Ignavibacteriales bacterium CG12_big_fil_rev_8_21_14_0_65_30_8]